MLHMFQMNLLTGNNGQCSPFRHSPIHDPFMKGRSYSVSSDYSLPPLYMRAPGFEREESQVDKTNLFIRMNTIFF